MKGTRKGLQAVAVLTGLLMGATAHATANTVMSSIRLLGLVSPAIRVLFFAWLVLAFVFVAGAAIWLFRITEGRVPQRLFTVAFWAASMPSIATDREAFSVLPFVLNFYVDLGGVQLGLNVVGLAALVFVWRVIRREYSGVLTEGKLSTEPGAIESQIRGS